MSDKYLKPVAEVLLFDIENVRMLVLESRDNGDDYDGDSYGDEY